MKTTPPNLWPLIRSRSTLNEKNLKRMKRLSNRPPRFWDSQTHNCCWEWLNKDEILIGKTRQQNVRHECSKAARMKSPNVLGGICAYSAVVTVVIKVIIGNSTQCRGVSAATVITDDNCHQRREERKNGEDTYTQQMNLFVLYHSTKGSYTKQPFHLTYYSYCSWRDWVTSRHGAWLKQKIKRQRKMLC